MLGLRKKENEYTYAPCTKQQAEELIRGLREIVPYVVIDCSSYIANDILSAVALMEADSVLQLASCDLKSVGYSYTRNPSSGILLPPILQAETPERPHSGTDAYKPPDDPQSQDALES